MENESETVLTDQTNSESSTEEVVETPVEKIETPTKEEKLQEEKEKVVETPEAKLARLERQAKQLRKKLGVESEVEPVVTKKEPKSDNFDYGEKAYLKSSGIEPTEFDFVKKIQKETGRDLDSLLTSEYFQFELKTMRNKKSINEAMPSSKPMRGEDSKTKVDYWISKGQLPPNTPEFKQLRRDVVNERYTREKGFTSS